jgi:hypothetical protein
MTNEANTPLLQEAHAVQHEARALMALRDQGDTTSKAFQKRMLRWVAQRRKLAATTITSPLEGLILSHTLLQCSGAIPVCMEMEDEGSLQVLASELLTASAGLIAYFESLAGHSRADLGLHEDYSATRQH